MGNRVPEKSLASRTDFFWRWLRLKRLALIGPRVPVVLSEPLTGAPGEARWV